MIVSVHNKSPTYMLPLPPNRSTLYELASAGAQAHTPMLQFLYLIFLSITATTINWLSTTRHLTDPGPLLWTD